MTPAVIVWSLQQMVSRRGGPTYLLERFGFTQSTQHGGTSIWFHAASVGEMRLAAPLISAVLERGVLVTCNTPEAYRLAIATWGNAITLRYCPLDYWGPVRNFLQTFRPSIIFVIETEIWPELYEQCHRRGAAIYVVNGRIGDKTFHSILAKRWIYPGALGRVSSVWARQPHDAHRFAAMGCSPEKIHTTGSIKMTRRIHDSTPQNPLSNRDFTLAISTHPGEEEIITEIWHRVCGANLLVLIPRHPPRAPALVKSLASDVLKVARTSQSIDLAPDTNILVVDTVGEVDAYCAHANFVFVGGSVVAAGGHNVLEPASWGKAIIVGPHTQNFAAEVEYLSSKEAISIVETNEALYEAWQALTHDLAFRQRLEARTREAHSALPDRVSDYVALVEEAVNKVCGAGSIQT